MKNFNIFTDRGSRIFSTIIIILLIAFAMRCAVKVTKYEVEPPHSYEQNY